MSAFNGWLAILMGLGMVLATAVGAWARERSAAERAFERFRSRFEPGVQTQPINEEHGRSFKQRRIIVNDNGYIARAAGVHPWEFIYGSVDEQVEMQLRT